MSERRTAVQWHTKLDEIIKHDPDIDSDDAVDLMADLAAVEDERDDLRAYFDFTMGSPKLSDDEVKALIARIEAARRSK
jgi:hypothetical protein